jgi:uncharacterized protein
VSELATATGPRRPPAPHWTLVDMLVIVLFSLLAAVALGVGFAFGLRALGFATAGDIIRDRPVIASAIAGAVVYGIFLLVTYVRIVRRVPDGWRGLGFRSPPLLPMLLSPLIMVVQLLAVAMTQLIVISIIGEFENPQIEAIGGGQGFSWTNYLLMLILVGAIAPLVEEVLFRGVLFQWLRARLPLALAVLLSAAIFSVAHMIAPLMPALFVVGIILALAYEFTGSLWLPIVLHAMQNSLAVTLIFVSLALDLPLNQ